MYSNKKYIFYISLFHMYINRSRNKIIRVYAISIFNKYLYSVIGTYNSVCTMYPCTYE